MLTNDPAHPKQILRITGPVARFVSIEPSRVVLRGEAGRPLRASAMIVPEKRFPFKIVDVQARKGNDIRYDLAERPDGSKGYLLTVENLRDRPGRYYDAIRITTDNRAHPTITIAVYGHILKTGEKRNQ